jgi:hypothetical protein
MFFKHGCYCPDATTLLRRDALEQRERDVTPTTVGYPPSPRASLRELQPPLERLECRLTADRIEQPVNLEM